MPRRIITFLLAVVLGAPLGAEVPLDVEDLNMKTVPPAPFAFDLRDSPLRAGNLHLKAIAVDQPPDMDAGFVPLSAVDLHMDLVKMDVWDFWFAAVSTSPESLDLANLKLVAPEFQMDAVGLSPFALDVMPLKLVPEHLSMKAVEKAPCEFGLRPRMLHRPWLLMKAIGLDEFDIEL